MCRLHNHRPLRQRQPTRFANLLWPIFGFLLAAQSLCHAAENIAGWGTWLPPAPLESIVESVAFPGDPELAKLARDRTWIARWSAQPPSAAWNEVVAGLVVKYQQNPLRAARAYAYVHIVIYDSMVNCARRGCSEVAMQIAMHAAAGRILDHLYPDESPGRMEALSHSAATALLAANGTDTQAVLAWQAGRSTGANAVRRALYDGWDLPKLPSARPKPGPSVWRAVPPLNVYDPLEPNARDWRTWVLKDGAEIEPPPPIRFGSPAYWAEMREVYKVSTSLTPEQRKIAEDWNLDLGSVTPGGVWNQRARELALKHRLDPAHAARLFATMNAATMDAFIACWHAKFKWWTVRPVSMIREHIDPAYLPPVLTPIFPSYVSGHSTASGAAAEVLAGFFPSEAAQLHAMASEAAISRLYGGIHFTNDNDAGLELGRRVGARALLRAGEAALPVQSAAIVR